MPTSLRIVLLALLASLGIALPSRADVRLPGFFNDHMVLQRQVPVRVWGWANPGEQVTVTIGITSGSTAADASGRWSVDKMPAMEAGGPHKIVVKGAKNTVIIDDVLVGEVWLCSGQSNMEWTVGSSTNAAKEIADADHPMIRHLLVPKRIATTPQDDIKAAWQVCSPKTAGGFTAAGYFMARHLHKELGVPVGLIHSSWGGTRIEPWTPPEGFAQVPALKAIHDSVAGRSPSSPQYQAAAAAHLAATEAWLAGAKKAAAEGRALEPGPAFPPQLGGNTNNPQEAVVLYNGMIHALVGYPLRGAIWYQGESNHNEGMLYFEKKKALIQGWRKLWGAGDFAFNFVQIAPYNYGNENPAVLATFWEAQEACLRIPGTGMVVTHDIATYNDIHPPNKQDVGKRLALLALRRTYGKEEVVDTGPVFKTLAVEDGKLRVTFTQAAGLKSRDGKPLTHFEVVGADGVFVPANAVIDGDSVVLSSPKAAKPVAMRFAWHKAAMPNLVNGAGLPAGAFRAGEVPRADARGRVGEAKDYTLVLDLDLEKLGGSVEYDVDQTAKAAKPFDRIAYLVELRTAAMEAQFMWVSMDAFTQDPRKLGVPTLGSGAVFQQRVANLTVASNVKGIVAGERLDGGNIEFWPHNYAPRNAADVPGASGELWDTGDERVEPAEGYGSMQVHNHKAGQTLFAVNNWRAGAAADVGIGNSAGTPHNTRDWTFAANAGGYAAKRLRVFVREAR